MGAYYIDGGNPVIGVSGAKPIIIRSNNSGSVLAISNSTYVEVTNLQFREGNTCVYVGTAGYPSDYNYVHDCVIGKGATAYGIRCMSGSDHNEIYNNTIDSDRDNESTYSAHFSGTLYDGVQLEGANYNKVYNNTISDWGHSGLEIQSGDNNEFYENYITAPTSADEKKYCRGFGIVMVVLSSDYNEIHHNYFDGVNVQNQIQDSSYNKIHNNIFDTIDSTESETRVIAMLDSYSVVVGGTTYHGRVPPAPPGFSPAPAHDPNRENPGCFRPALQ